MANSSKNKTAPIELTGSGGGVAEVLEGVTNDLTAYIRAQSDSGSLLSSEFQQLRTTSQAQTDAVKGNTAAVTANTTTLTSSSSGGTSGGSVLKTVGKALGTGLGLSPLIKGLIGLFGGGGTKTLPTLTSYTQPASINFEGEIVRSAATGGVATALQQLAGSEGTGTTAAAQSALVTQATNASAATSPQITVQVQAMDSRSFLDHSDEIAQAVRAAMLNSHSLNDVVNEL